MGPLWLLSRRLPTLLRGRASDSTFARRPSRGGILPRGRPRRARRRGLPTRPARARRSLVAAAAPGGSSLEGSVSPNEALGAAMATLTGGSTTAGAPGLERVPPRPRAGVVEEHLPEVAASTCVPGLALLARARRRSWGWRPSASDPPGGPKIDGTSGKRLSGMGGPEARPASRAPRRASARAISLAVEKRSLRSFFSARSKKAASGASAGSIFCDRLRLRREHRREARELGRRRERGAPGEHLVEQDAGAPEVGALVDVARALACSGLMYAGVPRNTPVRVRAPMPPAASITLAIPKSSSLTTNVPSASRVEEHVVRLEVAVDDALRRAPRRGPARMPCRMGTACASGTRPPFCVYAPSGTPSSSSMTRYGEPSSACAPSSTRTMFGWMRRMRRCAPPRGTARARRDRRRTRAAGP